MMDYKLLLVKCVTLLYRESEVSNTEISTSLALSIVDSIKLPENSLDVHTSREILAGLRDTVYWMINKSKERDYEKNELLQRVRINTKDDIYLYNAVSEGIATLDNPEEIKKQVLMYRKSLKDHLSSIQINSIISQAFQKINFSGENVNHRELVREIYSKLEPFTHDIIDSKHPSIVESISFDNEADMVELLTRSKAEISSAGVIRTGWQAINRMLGDAGGFKRGECVVIGALQHNFKTGFALNLFKHFALYNKPYMRDPAKKPLLLHLSLENELPLNIMWLYANLMENKTGQICNVNEVDQVVAAKFIKDTMGVNGYHVDMIRIEPNQCSFHDLIDLLIKYETEGYEIHAIVCDYLNMISKQGLDNTGPTGANIRDLFRRMRNYCAPRGITFITPHQLSTEAKMLVRQGVNNFVQEIANKGYYDGCRTIDQEVDIEITIHIEKIPGRGSFLDCQRGKHRTVIRQTRLEDLYTVLPFNDAGGVRDDINGEDSSMKSAGSKSKSSGGAEWFDL